MEGGEYVIRKGYVSHAEFVRNKKKTLSPLLPKLWTRSSFGR